MDRKILVTMVSGLALGALAMPSVAQTSKPVGLSIRAGVDFPTSSGTGTLLFGAGVEYNLSNLSLAGMGGPGQNGHISLSADYYGKNNAYALPVLINFVGSSQEFFYSVGAGAALSKASDDSNRWSFAYQFGVGYNFSHSQTPLFLEAKYFGNARSQLNAIGFYLGVRL